MKTRFILYLVLIATLSISCKNGNRSQDSLPCIDVSASYPEKEIRLEDLADIEYLQLELDDDFLFRRPPAIITSTKIIIGNDGDILIFSRDGKPLSKFNRKGNGQGYYSNIRELIYDEVSDEFFVRSNDKIVVYSVTGDFKREISLHEETYRNEIVNYDSGTLLLYDDHDVYPASFSFISKEDGSVIETINMNKDKKIDVNLIQKVGTNISILTAPAYRMVRHNAGYLLTDYSLDTVYLFSHDKKLSPILVREPKIQTMDPIVYLNSFIEAGNYVFVSAITLKNEDNRLPRMYLMCDKQTGSVYKQKIIFNDYKGKFVALSPETIANTQDSKTGLIILDLVELQEANSANKIGGKLKELVENADEEGNSIYMLLHFK